MTLYGDSKLAAIVFRRVTTKLDGAEETLTSLVVKLSKLDNGLDLQKKHTKQIKSHRKKINSLANKIDKMKNDVFEKSLHLGELLEAWSKIKNSVDRMSRRIDKFELKLAEDKPIVTGVSEAAE